MAEVQQTAMRMMRSEGFGNVTVEQIAAASGVSPSTVYRYFGTKEALVLWGDRGSEVVEGVRSAKVGKKRTVQSAFAESAVAVFAADEKNLLAQLSLVFANDELSVVFEHELLGERGALADVIASHRGAKSAGNRDVALAGALLGCVISVLDRWQAEGGEKSLTKQIDKAYTTLFV